MWDFPKPGLEPVSPALAGGFSTTAPPGKPDVNPFLNGVCSPLLDGQDLKQNGAGVRTLVSGLHNLALALALTVRGVSGYHTLPFTKFQVHLYGHISPNFSVNHPGSFHYIPFLFFHNLSETDRKCKSVVGKVN